MSNSDLWILMNEQKKLTSINLEDNFLYRTRARVHYYTHARERLFRSQIGYIYVVNLDLCVVKVDSNLDT